MKIITIGRGDEADIQYNQPEISRRHANIRYGMLGKMEIRDLSLNGTSVNGRRLPPNKFVPVSRKDVVSFADVAKLDWREVPDPMKPYRIGAIVLAIIIVVILIITGANRLFSSCSPSESTTVYEQSDGIYESTDKDKTDDNNDKAQEVQLEDDKSSEDNLAPIPADKTTKKRESTKKAAQGEPAETTEDESGEQPAESDQTEQNNEEPEQGSSNGFMSPM